VQGDSGLVALLWTTLHVVCRAMELDLHVLCLQISLNIKEEVRSKAAVAAASQTIKIVVVYWIMKEKRTYDNHQSHDRISSIRRFLLDRKYNIRIMHCTKLFLHILKNSLQAQNSSCIKSILIISH
jgi:hypothetical protein